MAFGKRSVVSENIWDFSVGLIGESGIGKTTTISQVCEKLVGSDGYILLDIGKEWGVKAISDITYEEVPNYKTWDLITKDIIKNKETDYPNLKLIVADTLDQLIEITEPKAVKDYNDANIGKKDFTQANTINQAWGGFGRGEDYVAKLILDRIEALRKVGVMFWFTGHTKSREIPDPLTNRTFTSLTTNMTQRCFNAFKTKTDILGVACIDRNVVQEGLGRKNAVTRKEETINKVVSESRKIKFRDENYCVDSKSRFPDITPEINLNADELIEAINNAIKSAKRNSDKTPVSKKAQSPAKVKVETVEPDDIEDIDHDLDEAAAVDIAEIRAKFKAADDDVKAEVRQIMKDKGVKKLEALDDETIMQIATLL